ncbi:MAG: hypothetical protein QOH36_2240 [Actinomycetota bacterium]|jgi:uncharacterized membrane protein YdbT with pleckstrin-like domain|nr:hypothetical protein [Actinomycetota bacterium]MEA2974359.1 hypothetical protein [Actinomycetota bacterium]
MPFPRKYLNEGEEIVVEMRPHWFFLAGPAVALLLALVLAIVVSARVAGDVQRLALIPLLLLVVVSLAWFVVRYAKWATTTFVVTTDRLIHRTGVVSKSGREIPLERLNDVSFHSTIFQRMLGAGDLLIESAGERGQQLFASFPHPEQTQNLIHHQIELAQGRDADRQAGRRELSPLEQLEKLEELRVRGVISQAEFDVKKAKLLDRL